MDQTDVGYVRCAMEDIEKTLAENYTIAVEAMFELESFSPKALSLFDEIIDKQ